MTTTKLTDAEIDGLGGVDLHDAVARAMGWTTGDGESSHCWYAPGEHMRRFKAWHTPPFDVTDIGKALSLLLGLDRDDWNISPFCKDVGEGFVVWRRVHRKPYEELATGPIADAAAVMSRAFLKLANRKGE